MGGPAEAAAGGSVAKGPTPASVCPAGCGSPRTGVGIWGAFHCGRVLAMTPATHVSEVRGVGKFTPCPRPVEDGAAADALRDRPAALAEGRYEPATIG